MSLDVPPMWHRPSKNDEPVAFTPPPASELIQVTLEPSADKSAERPAVTPADELIERPREDADTPEDTPAATGPWDVMADTSPEPADSVLPEDTQLTPKLESYVEDVTTGLEMIRRSEGDTITHLLHNTQGDIATLAFGAIQQQLLRERENAPQKQTPELPSAPRPQCDEVLERVKTDPSTLHNEVLQMIRRTPEPGSIQDMIEHADPRLAFKADMEKDGGEFLVKTEKEFFDSLSLNKVLAEGQEKSESDMVWELRKQGPNFTSEAEDEVIKHPLVAAKDAVVKAKDTIISASVYTGAKTKWGSDRNEQSLIKQVQGEYHSFMRKGDYERALMTVRTYINKINNDYVALQERVANADERFGQNAQDKAHSLPDHPKRLAALANLTWAVRWANGQEQAADEGFAQDYERRVKMAERADRHGDFANAPDKAAFRAGDRPVRYSPATIQMKATLAAMKVRNELAYTQDPHEAMNLAAKEMNDIYKIPLVGNHAAWMAQHPKEAMQGLRPSLTGKELQYQLEETATLYRMTLSYMGPTEAERVLDENLRAITERLDGEAILDVMKHSDQPPSPADEQYTQYSLERLQELETSLFQKLESEKRERGSLRASFRTEQAYRAVFAARAARERGQGKDEASQAYKAYEKDAAGQFNEQFYPGDTAVISGVGEKADGQFGAAALAMAGQNAKRIEISGNSKLSKGVARTIANAAIVDTGVTLPTSKYSTLIVEGRVSSRVEPRILDRVKPNGVFIMPASVNPALAAQMAIQISPEWYQQSDLPALVAKYATVAEQRKVEQTLQAELYRRSTTDSTLYGTDYRCALVPSETWRFTATQSGLGVRQGHARHIEGRPQERTLVVCRDQAADVPSDLYQRILEADVPVSS